MSTSYKTWVEIDTGILRANLSLLREAVGHECQTIAVVKSDAYGHGAHAVAKVAMEEGISRFAVASVSEGIALRKLEVNGEIIVLHPLMPFEVEAALRERLSPTVSDYETAEIVSARATKPIGIHLEVNTGINRLGIDWTEASEIIVKIGSLPNIKIAGVFTHFRASGEGDNGSVSTQMERFHSVIRKLRDARVSPGLTHAASSHAVARFKESHLDGVRPGMIIYAGVGGPSIAGSETASPVLSPLTRMAGVMRVKSRVLMTRTVLKGEWIHYGASYQTKADLRVAVLPIGYGTGYPRSLSNNADVLLAGKRAPVVGVIGMDMTIVDIDRIPQIKRGDIATIMGRDGTESITVHEVAKRAGTIPYEITCRLGNALPRVVVDGNETETAAQTPAIMRNAVG